MKNIDHIILIGKGWNEAASMDRGPLKWFGTHIIFHFFKLQVLRIFHFDG